MKSQYKYGYIPNINDKFGKWVVIDNSVIMIGKPPRRSRAITCKCECGTVSQVRITCLLTNRSQGCLCTGGERQRKRSINESIGTLSRTQFAYFKNCALRRDISWQLTMQFLWDLYVKQNKKCALSGVLLTLDIKIPRKSRTNTASIDRIDSTKSYSEDNVQWVHKDINRMKSNFTDEQFIELCKSVAKYQKTKNKFKKTN